MSIQLISEPIGKYQISKGVKRHELEALASDPRTKYLQFDHPLSSQEIDWLESVVFSQRPDISLRIYGFHQDACDFSFLSQLPSLRILHADYLSEVSNIDALSELKHLSELGIGITQLKNLDFLALLPSTLKKLYLSQTQSKSLHLGVLSRFSDLKYLYLESFHKGIETLAALQQLEEIVLRSVSLNDLAFLSGLKHLWSLDLKLGGLKHPSSIALIKQLRYLELWQVRGINDLAFISELTDLQNLFIQSLPQVKQLPDFSKNKALRRMYLENLKGLQDVSSLRTATQLETFIYVMAMNQDPDNFIPVFEQPSVVSVMGRFGSDKKNNRFEDLAKQYNKRLYEGEGFVYTM